MPNDFSYEKNGWIYIYIEGAPYERGKSYGKKIVKQFKKIQEMLDFLIYETYGLKWDYIVKRVYKDISKSFDKDKKYLEFKKEIEGIVAGVNEAGGKTTFEEMVAWNYYCSIPYWISTLFPAGSGVGAKEGGAPDKCSAFMAVGKDWTEDGGIVCAHNSFAEFIDQQYANCVVHIKPENGHEIIYQTSPGWIWSGTDFWLSSGGFIGTETTFGGFSSFKNNIPLFLRARKAMQFANTLDENIAYFKEGNSGDYANAWLIGDINTKEIMRLELGLKYVDVKKTKNGYFIGFNAPVDPRIRNLESSNTGFYDIRRHQGARNVRIYELMKKYKGKLNVNLAKTIIADHYDVYLKKINMSSRTICSHYERDDRKYMSQPGRPVPFQPQGAVDGVAVDSKLARNLQFYGRWGSSCGTAFNAKEFFKKHLQWRIFKDYIFDRPSQPWTLFGKKISKHTRKNRIKNKKTRKKINKKIVR
jgi:hypothetical protein